jgi:hypothetical protein
MGGVGTGDFKIHIRKNGTEIKKIEGSDAFFNNEYLEYDEFIQYTMHPRVQRIKTNAECSHSIPFVAACGIRKIHLPPHGKLELFALFVVENEAFGTSET